ncbi:MAG TPA: hypothetical protein VMT32_16770 [Bryobacteraceae bacterium]|nr:hypothetical protein [Bryobacteraceae bacterium]
MIQWHQLTPSVLSSRSGAEHHDQRFLVQRAFLTAFEELLAVKFPPEKAEELANPPEFLDLMALYPQRDG